MRETDITATVPWILLCAMVVSSGCRGGGQEPSTHEPVTSSAADAPVETDHCEPMPVQGTECSPDHVYCVIDWGEPCGHSTALWCVDGTWKIEEEANLCDDEPM
jgi:hypothetical protein